MSAQKAHCVKAKKGELLGGTEDNTITLTMSLAPLLTYSGPTNCLPPPWVVAYESYLFLDKPDFCAEHIGHFGVWT